MKDSLLLTFQQEDSSTDISRKTLAELAASLGVSETQAVHMALAEFAGRHLSYEADDGPLSEEQIRAIRALASPLLPQGNTIKKTSLL